MRRIYETEFTVNIVLPPLKNTKTAQNIKVQTLLKLKTNSVYHIRWINESTN